MDGPPFDRPQTQADRLETLSEISRVVSATLDLQALYRTIYKQVGRVMDTTQFFIAIDRPERQVTELPYHWEEGKFFSGQEIPYSPSVTQLVIQRGEALLFNTDKEYQDYVERNGLPVIVVGEDDSQAKLFVPLNTGSRTIGALSVQSPRPYVYTSDDIKTLSIIAAQAAVAIENARLFARTQDSVRQMQALLDIAQMINSSLDLQTVLSSILTGMREVMPYYLAAILLPNQSRGYLDIVESVGPLAEDRRENIKVHPGQGVTGTVYQRGEPLIVNNVREFGGYIEHGLDAVKSEMAVPLKRGDTIIGVLDVERTEFNAFSSDDLNLLSLFASQAAIAIENARLFTQQRQRVEELQTIQSIVQKLTPLHDIPAIATLINRELKQLIDYHRCRLFLLDPNGELLFPIPVPGVEEDPMLLHLGEGFAGWIAKNGKSDLIPDTFQDERVKQIPGTPHRVESMIGAPLIYEQRVQGVITLTKLGAGEFDENSLRLLDIIGAQTAIAFDRSRLYEELRNEAITDPLVNLYNRRYLTERLREEMARSTRSKHPLSAIMLDIDKFKNVNDSYGHDAGDVVLRELALLVRSTVRAEDIVARYGGEEFCVLLPEITLEEGAQAAERLRIKVDRHRMPQEAGVARVTVSVGVAELSPDDLESELFTRADLAMYEVKHRGGNRVCVADAEGFALYEAAV